MPLLGAQLLAKNIVAYKKNFLKHVDSGMDDIRKRLDQEITQNMSLACHTQADLNAMGNPYGIRPGKAREPIPENPVWLVHKQSGTLLRSKSSGIIKAVIENGNLKATAWVSLNSAIAPHALHIIWGTSKMIPRNFLNESLKIVKPAAVAFLKQRILSAGPNQSAQINLSSWGINTPDL